MSLLDSEANRQDTSCFSPQGVLGGSLSNVSGRFQFLFEFLGQFARIRVRADTRVIHRFECF